MSIISRHDISVYPTTKPAHALMRAEAVKRAYTAKLEVLIRNYERDIASALNDSFSPAYTFAELDASLHRLLRVGARLQHESRERAAAAV